MKIKKNDKVYILAGKDKGKTSVVIKVYPEKNKVLVEGINMVKKNVKPTKKMPQGGTIDMPMPMDASNVTVYCTKCEKKTKIAYKTINNKKKRVCKKCESIVGE
jgi:large subunit ribosomal protein L24